MDDEFVRFVERSFIKKDGYTLTCGQLARLMLFCDANFASSSLGFDVAPVEFAQFIFNRHDLLLLFW